MYILLWKDKLSRSLSILLSLLIQGFGVFSITPVLIRTSRNGRGGMVNYQHLWNTVKLLLKSSRKDFVVTTFIDFFRIPNTMPRYEECMAKVSKIERVEALESAMNENIGDRRFFSYIQLHEFEALLFSNNNGFAYYFPEECAKRTGNIVSSYENPEDINSSPEGAPSKRLLALKSDYNKVLEGNLIALEVGIMSMLEKCPRFNRWITQIIDTCKI